MDEEAQDEDDRSHHAQDPLDRACNAVRLLYFPKPHRSVRRRCTQIGRAKREKDEEGGVHARVGKCFRKCEQGTHCDEHREGVHASVGAVKISIAHVDLPVHDYEAADCAYGDGVRERGRREGSCDRWWRVKEASEDDDDPDDDALEVERPFSVRSGKTHETVFF